MHEMLLHLSNACQLKFLYIHQSFLFQVFGNIVRGMHFYYLIDLFENSTEMQCIKICEV